MPKPSYSVKDALRNIALIYSNALLYNPQGNADGLHVREMAFESSGKWIFCCCGIGNMYSDFLVRKGQTQQKSSRPMFLQFCCELFYI